ncbi:general stress protein [Candidatus Gracilibacteria bacterium]|nr:general stress protein [Candidatus Gracilibacteria bacterium]
MNTITENMILALFDTRADAESAIAELQANGYAAQDLSIIMKDGEHAPPPPHTTGAQVADSASSGLATGTVLGGIAGLLIGIGAITFPGIGALLIAGPLTAALGLTGTAASTVAGALTGAVAGGLLGALIGLGLPDEDARHYEERIKSGAILLAIPNMLIEEDEIKDILNDNHVKDVRLVSNSTRKIRTSQN